MSIQQDSNSLDTNAPKKSGLATTAQTPRASFTTFSEAFVSPLKTTEPSSVSKR